MKLRLLPTALLLLAAVVEFTPISGCTKAQEVAIETAAINEGITLGSCILSQALGGQTSAAAIAVTCGVPAGVDVLSVIAQMLATLQGPSVDGAVSVFSPSSPRAQAISALRAVHK